METMGVSGHCGVNGVLAASHVTKGDNIGIEHVFRLLNVLMVQVRKRKLVILTNAQASITSMPIKRLSGESFSKVMLHVACSLFKLLGYRVSQIIAPAILTIFGQNFVVNSYGPS